MVLQDRSVALGVFIALIPGREGSQCSRSLYGETKTGRDQFIRRRVGGDGGLVGGELFVVFNIREVRALRKGPWSRWRVRDERGEVDERPSHPRICLCSSAVFSQPFFTALLSLLARRAAFIVRMCLKCREYSSHCIGLHFYLSRRLLSPD